MNKKISPTLIGAFVLGAVALLVVAVIIFGSGKLFRKTKEFVIYFDTSVNGLNIGAPVKFKGVEIGAVKDIALQIERDTQVTKIPVIIEIDLEKLTSRGASGTIAEDEETFRQAIYSRGLRGQLLTESLVTGLLYVGLDFFPGTPVHLVQQSDERHRYLEIPTTPTTLEQAQDAVTRIITKIEEIDFKSLIASLEGTVGGINQLVNAPELKSTLRALERATPKLDEAIAGFTKLTTTIGNDVTRLSENLQQTSTAAREAMVQADLALKQTDIALKEAQVAMTNVRAISDPESPPFYEMTRSLREVAAAARSLRLLTNFIERNPRALVFGKPENQEGR
jgi:paraquat-inducible protein B